jgi:hypothetical protein
VVAAGALGLALSLAPLACGGSSGHEATAKYPVKVVTASFPAKQRLGQTSLMRIGVRNTGRHTVPALTVSIGIKGKEGETASLPFAIHDPQPGLAQPDRPVWVLALHYPKLAGSSKNGGAEGAERKTFNFGPLKPGATREAIWKLSAVRAGTYTVVYKVDASFDGSARAVTAGGVEPGGSFTATISTAPPETIVTDNGEVVEIQRGHKHGRP